MLKKIKYVYRGYRFRYKIDPNEIKYVSRHLKPGDIAVDIGSHKGGYLYWMRQGVGKAGKVYGFEPQTKLYHYLQEVCGFKGYENVVVEHKGLSNQAGTLKFFIPKTKKGDSPGARIDFLDDGTDYQISEVEVTTLDAYFQANDIIPKLIKIDVEGHEKQVILGGRELLVTHKPRLVMECENRHLTEGDIFDVFRALTDIGYQGYFFMNNDLQPLRAFDINRHQKMGEGRFWEADDYINNFIFEG